MVKLRETETYKNYLEQQFDKGHQRHAAISKQYKMFKFDNNEIQKETNDLEQLVDKVRVAVDKIEAQKMQWTEMVLKQCSNNLCVI